MAVEQAAKRAVESEAAVLGTSGKSGGSSGGPVDTERELAQLYTRLSIAEEKAKNLETLKSTYEKTTSQLTRRLTEEQAKAQNYRDEVDLKTTSMQHLQDEMLALQIQLNVIEDNMKQVQKENEALVERWMAKVAGEAEKLNDANAFIERYSFTGWRSVPPAAGAPPQTPWLLLRRSLRGEMVANRNSLKRIKPPSEG
ncbi:hypothetical protein AWJ20_172 [Sugiyamaella lignohabitans]|uniref:Autophagy-related protein 16 domain-containing protein n=1 Tax=Sugiyamaella lignohabitans TaxID=796027 RepID=A0A161HZP1_9ASCO|nr:uncharacterized protein AWJ20_172 [Sugiyamaella lignohabitans]ANB11945.1 hypothetical protein AWJ20_172 [Sugiyamaella lignohabitans]